MRAKEGEAMTLQTIWLAKGVRLSQPGLDFFARQNGVLYQPQGQLRVLQNGFANARPILNLLGHRPVLGSSMRLGIFYQFI